MGVHRVGKSLISGADGGGEVRATRPGWGGTSASFSMGKTWNLDIVQTEMFLGHNLDNIIFLKFTSVYRILKNLIFFITIILVCVRAKITIESFAKVISNL